MWDGFESNRFISYSLAFHTRFIPKGIPRISEVHNPFSTVTGGLGPVPFSCHFDKHSIALALQGNFVLVSIVGHHHTSRYMLIEH